MQSQNPWHTIKSAINKDIKHMSVRPEPKMYQNLKDTTTIIKSMDIEPLNVDASPHGHQTR